MCFQIAEATSDPIESFFGTHDQTAAVQSKNVSFHVTGTLATWTHNKTAEWLNTLSSSQRDLLLRDAVRQGRLLKRQTDKDISVGDNYVLVIHEPERIDTS